MHVEERIELRSCRDHESLLKKFFNACTGKQKLSSNKRERDFLRFAVALQSFRTDAKFGTDFVRS
jgi:hypothetical protein